MRGENLPVIFGLKLRKLREAKGLGLKEMSELSGMSISYLNEIEKGKKYPKADKILQLSNVLEVAYDDMVSLKLGGELDALGAFLDSPLIQALPLQMIGLAPRDVIELLSKAPKEVSVLIRTLVEIAGSYDMHVEHFFYAMLRSYQETHRNYFEEIEDAVSELLIKKGWGAPVSLQSLKDVLEKEYGIAIDEKVLGENPELSGFRSVWIEGPPERLLINPRLSERQKAFQLGREIGYRELGLKARGTTSSRAEVESFEQVLNDFKASYYSGALLINRAMLIDDLKKFFSKKRWDPQDFVEIMYGYRVTPEMFLYRLTQIIPTHFGLEHLHFHRVNHHLEGDTFHVNKQLNLAGPGAPMVFGEQEHVCRRWVAMNILRTLARNPQPESGIQPLAAAQRCRFMPEQEEYFLFSLARPLSLTPGTNTSVTLGVLSDEAFRETVKFHDDPALKLTEVHGTCERCPLEPDLCGQRVAPPEIHQSMAALEERDKRLVELLERLQGK
ncbi:MAG: XRE family transcriptional regulator [Deltaproteobacteria bacterium]|nr:XRE family transcriptional regulator [Deltaproteobacteria bacterium]